MRVVGWLLLLLVGLIWLLSRMPDDASSAAPSAVSAAASNWRRTTRGWERLDLAAHAQSARPLKLHPAIVASLEILLVLGAYVVFSTGPQRPRAEADPA